MKGLAVLLLLPLAVLAADAGAGSPREASVQTIFAELRSLKPMEPRREYTVIVDGHTERGPKERFLRRRTPAEVTQSGLTSGCGDYASLFIERIEAKGCETLLVDGAEISLSSLRDHFSGHAVVAIREKGDSGSPWWLVDSTNLKVISHDWSPAEKQFTAFGHIFWIGYCGPRSQYPVHDPDELKAFYTRTLAATPTELYNRAIHRLAFTVDSALRGANGELLNPHLGSFLKLQDQLLKTYHIQPEQSVPVRLVPAGDDTHSDLKFSRADGWVAHIGLKSACSPSLLDYFDRAIRERETHVSQAIP